jgi:hypothetical protein
MERVIFSISDIDRLSKLLAVVVVVEVIMYTNSESSSMQVHIYLYSKVISNNPIIITMSEILTL